MGSIRLLQKRNKLISRHLLDLLKRTRCPALAPLNSVATQHALLFYRCNGGRVLLVPLPLVFRTNRVTAKVNYNCFSLSRWMMRFQLMGTS